MDFFAKQRHHTQRSLLLYGLFFVVVALHVLLVVAICYGILLLLDDSQSKLGFIALAMMMTVLSFVGGSIAEYSRLKDGGRAVAKRVGAIRLFVDTSSEPWVHSSELNSHSGSTPAMRVTPYHIAVKNPRHFAPVYRRYHEFAEQLAIACGIRPPTLYVLANEQGINAFVAGRHASDMALVVTQGALDKLSDEGLYGLIGHEYGHILHGDAKFNLHLMVVLAGLQMIFDATNPIDEEQSRQQGYSTILNRHNLADMPQSEVDKQARQLEAQTANLNTKQQWVDYWRQQNQLKNQLTNNAHHPYYSSRPSGQGNRLTNTSAFLTQKLEGNISSSFLHLLSYSSMASAQFIKHSFNREREFLADATSVQLTRSPAILETLKAIYRDNIGSELYSTPNMNGMSHFFFAPCGLDIADSAWFATHPSLSSRMQAINSGEYQAFAHELTEHSNLNLEMLDKIQAQRQAK
ncbi:M48 family metalloprotease [Psychrobacter sp. I-STPA10]|uniref:M48 family metalloprotease n=1 Tax=Psychrobacter sp. I-STPA10 TaxID=2585769 RepID=UPI001E57365F|nr:M48 family metalloprotease [Psychrobacter sp. I-STPA10]